MSVPHLLSLAELSPSQITRLLRHSHLLKNTSLPWLKPIAKVVPQQGGRHQKQPKLVLPSQSLFNKSIALLFSKRSTRTRVSAETAATLLGGRALFLGKEDIQLGVNESLRDSARVIGGMTQGIFARVGEHSEIEVWILCTDQSMCLNPCLWPRNWPNILQCPCLMLFRLYGIQHRH